MCVSVENNKEIYYRRALKEIRHKGVHIIYSVPSVLPSRYLSQKVIIIAEYTGVKVLFWQGKLAKIILLTHSRLQNLVFTALCTAIPGKIQTTASAMI
jgi:hypothetical protein